MRLVILLLLAIVVVSAHPHGNNVEHKDNPHHSNGGPLENLLARSIKFVRARVARDARPRLHFRGPARDERPRLHFRGGGGFQAIDRIGMLDPKRWQHNANSGMAPRPRPPMRPPRPVRSPVHFQYSGAEISPPMKPTKLPEHYQHSSHEMAPPMRPTKLPEHYQHSGREVSPPMKPTPVPAGLLDDLVFNPMPIRDKWHPKMKPPPVLSKLLVDLNDLKTHLPKKPWRKKAFPFRPVQKHSTLNIDVKFRRWLKDTRPTKSMLLPKHPKTWPMPPVQPVQQPVLRRSGRKFPSSWGSPPVSQTLDLVQLPGGFGMGSSTLARWIHVNMTRAVAHPKHHYAKRWGHLSVGRMIHLIKRHKALFIGALAAALLLLASVTLVIRRYFRTRSATSRRRLMEMHGVSMDPVAAPAALVTSAPTSYVPVEI